MLGFVQADRRALGAAVTGAMTDALGVLAFPVALAGFHRAGDLPGFAATAKRRG
jgi:hypothetical protein